MIIWNAVFPDKPCVVNTKHTICDPLEIGLYLWHAFLGDVEGGVPHPPLGALAADQLMVHVLLLVPLLDRAHFLIICRQLHRQNLGTVV